MYTEEQLQAIEQLAENLFSLSEIASFIEVPEIELRIAFAEQGSEVKRHYMKGKMKTVLEMRHQEIELIKTGSQASINKAQELLKKMTHEEK